MDKLLREETIVVNCLSKYECLQWEQVIKLLFNKKEEVAQRILVGLKKKQIILEDTPGYLTLDLRSKSDYKRLQAFWVLLEYIDKIKPEEHYPANYPSEIFFLMHGVQYEIIVLNKGEEHLLKMLFMENRSNSIEDDDLTKYIVVVPSVEDIDEFAAKVPDSAFEKEQVLFATVAYEHPEDACPKVDIYKV